MKNTMYSTTRLVTKTKPIIVKKNDDKLETILLLPEGEGRIGQGGLRTKNCFKKSYEGKPVVSVITVVFNGEKYLEETILSVINQTYDNVEYIIIDGGSTDGTVDIIKKYEHAIDYWVSENDGGIYYAMNKGIDLATGDWLNFMNAGDRFYSAETIKQCSEDFINSNYTFVYGDMISDYGSFTKLNKAKNPDQLCQLWKGMVFSHQSVFIKSNYHKCERYSLNYPIAGDFEFFFRSYINGESFLKSDQVVSVMSVEGVSDTRRTAAIIERLNVVKKYHQSYFRHGTYYRLLLLDTLIRSIVKVLLPKKIVGLIQKIK